MDHCPAPVCPGATPLESNQTLAQNSNSRGRDSGKMDQSRSTTRKNKKQYSVGLGKREATSCTGLPITKQNVSFRLEKTFQRQTSFNKAKSPLVERNFQARALNSKGNEMADKQKGEAMLKLVKNKNMTTSPVIEISGSNSSSEENKPPPLDGICSDRFRTQEEDEPQVQSILKSPVSSPSPTPTSSDKEEKRLTKPQIHGKTTTIKVKRSRSKQRKRLSVSTSGSTAKTASSSFSFHDEPIDTGKDTLLLASSALSVDNEVESPTSPHKRSVSFAAENTYEYIDPSIATETRSDCETIHTDNTSSTGTDTNSRMSSLTSGSECDDDTVHKIRKAGAMMIKALGIGAYGVGEKVDVCLSPTFSDMESQPSMKDFYKHSDNFFSESKSETGSHSSQYMKELICCGNNTQAEV